MVLDEDILKEEGCKDFAQYLAVPGTPEKDLIPDFFLDEVEDPQQVIAAGKGDSKVSKCSVLYSSEVHKLFYKISLVNVTMIGKICWWCRYYKECTTSCSRRRKNHSRYFRQARRDDE